MDPGHMDAALSPDPAFLQEIQRRKVDAKEASLGDHETRNAQDEKIKGLILDLVENGCLEEAENLHPYVHDPHLSDDLVDLITRASQKDPQKEKAISEGSKKEFIAKIQPRLNSVVAPIKKSREELQGKMRQIAVELLDHGHLLEALTTDRSILSDPTLRLRVCQQLALTQNPSTFLSLVDAYVGIATIERISSQIEPDKFLGDIAFLLIKRGYAKKAEEVSDTIVDPNVRKEISQFLQQQLNPIEINLREVSRDNPHLTESKIKEVAKAIFESGARALQEAQKNRMPYLIDSDSSNEIMVTKSGSLYTKVSLLGKGVQKDVFLFQRIGKLSQAAMGDISRSTAKQAAVSIPKPLILDPHMRSMQESEIENEAYINHLLRKILQLSLSHVALSKVILCYRPSENMIIKSLLGQPYNGGNVNQRLIAGPPLSDAEKELICSHFITGMMELHQANVIHRDLKSDNILLDIEEIIVPKEKWPPGITPENAPMGYKVEMENGKIKNVRQTIIKNAALCDLGKASRTDVLMSRFLNAALFNPILPPGFLLGQNSFDLPVDLYAAGRTVYQIFAGIPLKELKGIDFFAPERKEIIDRLNGASPEDRPKIFQELMDWDCKQMKEPEQWEGWSRIPPRIQVLIKRMVDVDPNQRPTPKQCVTYFKTFDEKDLQKQEQALTNPVENTGAISVPTPLPY